MPVYEDDTLEGAFRKAIGGARYAQKQETQVRSPLTQPLGTDCRQAHSLLVETRRGLEGHIADARRTETRLSELTDNLEEARETQENQQTISDIRQLLLLGNQYIGAAASVVDVFVPGTYNPETPVTRHRQVINQIQNITFPENQLRFLIGRVGRIQGAIGENTTEFNRLLIEIRIAQDLYEERLLNFRTNCNPQYPPRLRGSFRE